jgi:hypothetical protein
MGQHFQPGPPRFPAPLAAQLAIAHQRLLRSANDAAKRVPSTTGGLRARRRNNLRPSATFPLAQKNCSPRSPKRSVRLITGSVTPSVIGIEYARIRMAHYLVRAKPKMDLLPELHQRLRESAFINLRPFGKGLTESLNNARIERDGTAIWEEEDYCSPPLAQERAAVLDLYFDAITVELVERGDGWQRIESLPKLNANV